MFARSLNITEIIKEKSIFLLGPRQTGKSTLLRTLLPEALYIDLLSPPQFRQLAANPEILESMCGEQGTVVIDEIQNLPEILNVVHRLLESRMQLRFVLTGSSARKLRRGGVNLLGGRARLHLLLPITTHELASSVGFVPHWSTLLERGGLPSMLNSKSPFEDLEAYVGLYLQEEIQSEALVRSIPHFSRFLNVIGSCNGQQLNYEKIASDVGVSAKIIRSYVQVLEDTLVAHTLAPFQHSTKRKAVSAPKFYFFDVGVANAIRGIARVPIGSENFGNNLEHLVYLELKAHREYFRFKHEISFWRTVSKHEVDFVMKVQNRIVAIEVKGTEHPDTDDCKGLKAFAEDFQEARKILVCNTALSRVLPNGIEIFSAADFFSKLWAGAIHPEI